MFEKFLTFGIGFDWITPFFVILQLIFNGPACDFGIPDDIGWDIGLIKRFLRYHEVDVWGLINDFDEQVIFFSVRKSDAEYVYHLLETEELPIMYGPLL